MRGLETSAKHDVSSRVAEQSVALEVVWSTVPEPGVARPFATQTVTP